MDAKKKLAGLLTLAGDNVFIVPNQSAELQKQRIYEEVAQFLIAHGVTVQEWSPAEAPPPDRGNVLVCAWWHETWQTLTGWYDEAARMWHIITPEGDLPWLYVSRWSPLPKPPKGV